MSEGVARGAEVDERTLRNLRDAGCSEEYAHELEALPNTAARLRSLRRRRKQLVACIRCEQAKLDALDYLIFELGKEDS